MKKTFQIECGEISETVSARTAAAALRKIMRRKRKWRLGSLARFREIRVGHGGRIFVETPWFFQSLATLLRGR